MTLDLEGSRPRYFHERETADAQQGYPLNDGVSTDARMRIVREIVAKAWFVGQDSTIRKNLTGALWSSVERVLGQFEPSWSLPDSPEKTLGNLPLPKFLAAIEIAANQLYIFRRLSLDIAVLQSILADDLSSYRFVDVGTRPDLQDKFQIQKIENQHLHREVVDRTFELTRIAEFASAQHDYAEAWKSYSQGDLDGALVSAHKAFESAAKVIIKRVDDKSNPDQMTAAVLAAELKRLDIIPAKLVHVVNPLVALFQNSGALRNAPGAGHGSLDLTAPEANIALLGLRLSGSFVSFLAQCWETMKPPK